MPLFHTEEQTLLKKMAAPFLAEHGPTASLRALRDGGSSAFAPDLWQRFIEMELPGLLIPPEHGGSGLGHVEAGIIMEEIGRNLSPSPFLATAIGAATALKQGSAAYRVRWMPGLAAGKIIAAFAIDEGRKHRPEATALSAARVDAGFRLNGIKTFVIGGHLADLLIVAARTSGNAGEQAGITLFAIRGGAPGIAVETARLVDSSISATLTFEDVHVGDDMVIGDVDGGWAALSATLDALRVGAAAELLGVGNAAADLTLAYLKQRSQFGRLIGEFQALQHRAVYVYTDLQIAHAAVLKAQQLLDDGDPGASLMVAVAKAKVGQASRLAVQEGLQMHGGIGMTDEHDIGLYLKRQRVLDEMFGDSFWQAERVARLGGY